MRVLYVHQSSDLYGSDRTLLTLVERMREQGVEALVLLPDVGPLKTELEGLGVETHVTSVGKLSRSGMKPAGWLPLAQEMTHSVREIDQLLAGRRIDLVHSNTLAVLAGAIWAWRRRVPHLWHVHELIISPRLLKSAFPLMLRFLADRVVCNSTLTRAWIVGEQPRLSRITSTIWNGIPALRPVDELERSAMLGAMDANPEDVVISLLGRINHFKGQMLFCDAIEQLHARGQAAGLRFVIVGSPPPGQEVFLHDLRSRIAASPARDQIALMDFISDPSAIWEVTDIAVVPSTSPEPFGLVAIEAMRSGKPVVAAAHGGLLDIVKDEETGLLFPPSDAEALARSLHRLAIDKPWRVRLGEAGRRRQEDLFSLDAHVLRMKSEYLEVTKSR